MNSSLTPFFNSRGIDPHPVLPPFEVHEWGKVYEDFE
jgi:hypothetical protein